ncbi:MAG: hypothetical protein IJI92_05835 [Erysipelotrichaceae bacterium]|nr:hypothetical protein [Erysipelotrichaceae bacterium]
MNLEYNFQHRIIPKWVYTTPQFFNDLINCGEQTTLYRAAKKFYEDNNTEFPYKEEDYSGFHTRLDVDTVAVCLRFPTPAETPLCFCAFIFMDTKTNRLAYYTLEKGIDPIDSREMRFLCGWNNEGTHQEYGAYYVEKYNFGDIWLVRFFYGRFRDLRKDIGIPSQPKEENENTRVLKCPACKQEIIFDATDIKEGNELLVFCNSCGRIYHLKFENNEFLILNKIQEDKAEA